MKDTYGREISYLRLSVTELCNLRCRYCMPAEGVCKKEHDEMLTEEEIVLAVETAAELGVTKLRITGGEPLVKKNIVSICRRAAAVLLICRTVPVFMRRTDMTRGSIFPRIPRSIIRRWKHMPGGWQRLNWKICLPRRHFQIPLRFYRAMESRLLRICRF